MKETIGKSIVEIIYDVSLGILTYYSLSAENFELFGYQIAVTFFLVSGIVKYGLMEDGKALAVDMIKEFITVLSSVILLMYISGAVDYEPCQSFISAAVFNAVLAVVLWLVSRQKKFVGKAAYYTYAVGVIATMVLIAFGIRIAVSVVLGVVLTFALDYVIKFKIRKR